MAARLDEAILLQLVIHEFPETLHKLTRVSRKVRRTSLDSASLLVDRCRVCGTKKNCCCWHGACLVAPTYTIYGIEVALLGPSTACIWSRGRIACGVQLEQHARLAWELTLILILHLPFQAWCVRSQLENLDMTLVGDAAKLFMSTVPVFTKRRAALFTKKLHGDRATLQLLHRQTFDPHRWQKFRVKCSV